MTRRLSILAVAIALSVGAQTVPYTFSDPQIYVRTLLPKCDAYDDMESYTVTADVNGLNAGTCWAGPYVDNYPYFGVGAGDDMESYSIGAGIDGLNGGNAWYEFWGGAYVLRDLYKADDMESYGAGSSLNGLNGGDPTTPFWGGAYVDR